jgi:hypothetical protein
MGSLHGFMKKAQATPKREVEIARARLISSTRTYAGCRSPGRVAPTFRGKRSAMVAKAASAADDSRQGGASR